jgi:hypothetical protein
MRKQVLLNPNQECALRFSNICISMSLLTADGRETRVIIHCSSQYPVEELTQNPNSCICSD